MPDTLYRVVARHGGIPPPVRRRAARTLSTQEREEIHGRWRGGLPPRISRRLGRAPSTISREVRRHGAAASIGRPRRGRRGTPRAAQAVSLGATPRLRRRRRGPLAAVVARADCGVARHVRWDPAMRVSHKTIYRSLFVQSRGVEKALFQHLRRRGDSAAATPTADGRGQIVDAVSIRVRPAESRTAPSRAIGKATSWRGPRGRMSGRWSSATRAMCCW